MTNEFEGYLAVTSLIIELEQQLKVFWNGEKQGFTKQASKLINKSFKKMSLNVCTLLRIYDQHMQFHKHYSEHPVRLTVKLSLEFAMKRVQCRDAKI